MFDVYVFNDTFSLALDAFTFISKGRKSSYNAIYIFTFNMSTNFPFKVAFLFPILLSVFLAVRFGTSWNSIQLFLDNGSGLSRS